MKKKVMLVPGLSNHQIHDVVDRKRLPEHTWAARLHAGDLGRPKPPRP